MKNRTHMILALLLLTACSPGINQANNLGEQEPAVQPSNQSMNQPLDRPATTVQPSAVPVTSKAPSIASIGRIPRSGVVNGSTANNIGLNDIQILSPSVITAAGSFGIAVASADGGKTWLQRNFNGEDEVFSLTQRGTDLISGRKGGVFVWDDPLQTWQILSTDITEEVARLRFFDDQNGIAIAGYINGTLFRTSDGGRTWSEVGTIPSGRNGTTQIRILILDAASKSATILADGVVYLYNNGSLQQSLTDMHCCNGGIAFRDSQNGFAFSTLGGYVTQDGGQTFNKQSSIVLDGSVVDMATVRSMSFGSSNDGILLTGSQDRGKAYVTRNGGKSWQLLKLNESILGKLTGLRVFVENNELIGMGFDSETYTLYRISVPI